MKKSLRVFVWLLSGLLVPAALIVPASAQMSYRSEIQKWRNEYEAKLKSDDGWLAVAGLFWLKQGTNSIGSDPSNDIVLPTGSAPAKVGVLEFNNGKITLSVERGVSVTANGQPVTTLEMKPDSTQNPDIVAINDLRFHIIKRGHRYGVRLKDKNSYLRREFTGTRWYPVRESYRVTARFVPYPQPREIAIPNILGDVEKTPSPGYVLFNLHGKQYRLEPVSSGEKLFFIFHDLTAGKSTYPAGRFLYSDLPKDGKVTLDFNQATNPPCAFTPFATCPLPPRQNRLKVAIEAGELAYHAKSEGEGAHGKAQSPQNRSH